ncbi:Emopamil binding protein-domain-containing protein [Xylariomycetidae sp. FL0641]|nr:Emopamil binding protein-domain-containing protein [Xylariomycetidae sp. FL0641]
MASWWPLKPKDSDALPVVDNPPEEQFLGPLHPYHPLGVNIPDYAPNDAPVPILLASMGGALGCTLLAACVVARRVNPGLSWSSLAVFCWFVMNGCLHCVFEGYFVLNHRTVASSQQLLAQLWKEYALSDSRYLTSDYFMLSVESITVFVWGPLCFANAISIIRGSALQHPLRIIACMAHLYGVALYYSTSLCESYFTSHSHSRPEFLYFWVYYVGFNLPWAIIPAILLLNSVTTIARAIIALDKMDQTLNDHRKKDGTIDATEESKKLK